jgi:UAA transporter family
LGILILSVAMVLSAGLGLLQEITYRKYGKAWREGLFYTVSKLKGKDGCQEQGTIQMDIRFSFWTFFL